LPRRFSSEHEPSSGPLRPMSRGYGLRQMRRACRFPGQGELCCIKTLQRSIPHLYFPIISRVSFPFVVVKYCMKGQDLPTWIRCPVIEEFLAIATYIFAQSSRSVSFLRTARSFMPLMAASPNCWPCSQSDSDSGACLSTHPFCQEQARKNGVDSDLGALRLSQASHEVVLRGFGYGIRHGASPDGRSGDAGS